MKQLYEYRLFENRLIAELNQRKPSYVDDFHLEVRQSNNGYYADVLVAEYEERRTVIPSFPMDKLYEDYQQSGNLEAVVEDVLRMVHLDYQKGLDYGENDITVENAKSCLTLRLINKEWNREAMEQCCYYEVAEDLIAIPRWEMQLGEQRCGFLVSKDIQRNQLHLTDEELLSMAMANVMNQNFAFQGLSEIAGLPASDEKEPQVLSNEQALFGAIAIMNNDVMKQLQDYFEEKFLFILPADIHSVIICPASRIESVERTHEDCKRITMNCVDERERLSTNIYAYFQGKIRICNTQEHVHEFLHDRIKTEEQKRNRIRR